MKNIIFISLFIITLSKVNEVEFNKEITFDKNNNEFELKFPEDGSLYISVKFNIPNILNLKILFNNKEVIQQVNSTGIGMIMSFKKDNTYELILEYKTPSNESGIIWMNP